MCLKIFVKHFLSDGNDLNNQRDKNFQSVRDFDVAIKELEERSKRLNEPRQSQVNLQDKLLAEVDSLQNQIITLHNANEDRSQLIHVLDNRDAELRAHHMELQSKLQDLQTRKLQVDQLVDHLHNLDEAEEDDVGKLRKKFSQCAHFYQFISYNMNWTIG